ncbi:MAG: type I restriction-modification system subunit M [Commensalibacter sp.]
MVISSQQRAELQRRIWQIANDVRGSVDGWDFKQYVLGTLFYRFISEYFTNYMESNDESVHYAKMSDKTIPSEIIEDAIKSKGYFIYPSQLFVNIVAKANTNDNLNTDLKAIFQSIESSANGYPSEKEIKGLFADFDTTSNRLGNTVAEKNKRLAAVLKGVADLNFGDFKDHHIDLFGDAYEYLISNYAANAGKSGGEFFTPQSVSKLIAKLALHKQDSVNKIYDPAAGSGSLLLRAKRQFDEHIIQEGFFGQEINHTTYNLARMNMFLHNINYDKFNIALGNTLIDPQFKDEKPFDAIVSNPPYSIKWIGSDDPTLINDERFAPAGVLAPKSKADFAFILHALNYLSAKGRAVIVCFPGIFYRGGAEQKIRQYLIDNNYIETVISLAPNLFFGTSIAVNILVLSKHKSEYKTQFIDASKLFKKETNNNILMDEHIDQIIAAFDDKKDKDYFAKSVDNTKIAENGYNLSVNSYVETEDTREIIDIKKLNAEIKMTVEKIDHLRAEIDSIIAEIEA